MLVLLIATAVVAGIDWWAIAERRRGAERVAKPATMLLLVAVAATLGDAPGDVRSFLVVGALFDLVGDVALLSNGESAFLVGLGAFAAGHLAYAASALSLGVDPVWALTGLVVMGALLGYRFVTRIVAGARRAGGSTLARAVVFYAVVIGAMVVTAWGPGLVVAGAGATAFAVSDWVLGHQRFAGPTPGGGLSVMIPYHVGQALLVLGLATSG